jgi:hypothetical protein
MEDPSLPCSLSWLFVTSCRSLLVFFPFAVPYQDDLIVADLLDRPNLVVVVVVFSTKKLFFTLVLYFSLHFHFNLYFYDMT